MTETAVSPIAIHAEPIDLQRCRFVASQPIAPGRWAYFASQEDAKDSALASRLLLLPGARSVLLSHDSATITRDAPATRSKLGGAIRGLRRLFGDAQATADSWKVLAVEVGKVLRDHLATGETAVSEAVFARNPSNAELRLRVQMVLDTEVNPVLAGHGGGVSILDLIDNVVYVRLSGGCQGCGLVDNTLKHGVEGAIRDAVPEIGAIFDLTDHSSGQTPYRAVKSPFSSGSR